jgi:heme oxygenase (biliverdin-IX-beta and delta-forming)
VTPSHRALRDATAAAHEQVDRTFAGFDLASRPGYAGFLAAQAEALLPIEAALDAAPPTPLLDDWAQRRRGALLCDDLADLDAPAPAPASPPPAPTGAALAGTLYVLEGSRLGGRFLARSVPPAFPRRFLDADQPVGGWRGLLDRIDTILYEPVELQRAIDAALRVFAAYEQSGRNWVTKG